MFDKIRQRLARHHRRAERLDPVSEPLSEPVSEPVARIAASDSQKRLVLDQLRQASARQDRVAVRDLHRLSGLPQSVALRALRALEEDGLVEREENLFDALAGEVRLK